MSKVKKYLPEIGMLLPAFLFLLIFVFIPFFLSIYFSFTNERLIPRPIPTKFIGLDNYRIHKAARGGQHLLNTQHRAGYTAVDIGPHKALRLANHRANPHIVSLIYHGLARRANVLLHG